MDWKITSVQESFHNKGIFESNDPRATYVVGILIGGNQKRSLHISLKQLRPLMEHHHLDAVKNLVNKTFPSDAVCLSEIKKMLSIK